MQNNTLSVWQICPLLEIMYKSLSHIKINDVWERKRTSRRIKNANSFSLLTQRRERNKARRRQKQGTLSCDISHDYEIIANQSNNLILTSLVNAPQINQSGTLSRDQICQFKPVAQPIREFSFWIPSLVCPALSLSASEVKLLVRAEGTDV